MIWPWRRARSRRHGDPVPADIFRLMLLDDAPYPTFLGDRAWCTGEPYWEDKTCKCRHTEDENK